VAAYYYVARTRQGERIKGVVEAKRGFSTFFRQTSSRRLKIFQPRVKGQDLIIFTRQFATLISAGLPIVQTLGILIDQTPNATLKDIVTEVRKDVEAGKALSGALSKHSKIFAPLFTNMVKAGEMGGILETVLDRLAGYLEYAESVRQRIKTAMRYPIFVMFMAGGLTVCALFLILPKMEVLFAESFQAELPALTQFLLNLSDFAGDKLYLAILIRILPGQAEIEDPHIRQALSQGCSIQILSNFGHPFRLRSSHSGCSGYDRESSREHDRSEGHGRGTKFSERWTYYC